MLPQVRFLVTALILSACANPTQPSMTPVPTTEIAPILSAGTSTPSAPLESQSTDQKWIEVILEQQTIYLWEGDQVWRTLKMSSGVGNSPATTTYAGKFTVETMYRGPEETAPGVFVRDIVIFDWEHGNGFHSLPMDDQGKVLDSTIGTPASAGCIRVAESSVLYDFAALGMKVVIRE